MVRENRIINYKFMNKVYGKYWDIALFLIGLLIFSVFIFKKCIYGFGNIDESFYLTIPYRLCQGDKLFINEWHLSQMSSFLLYPFMKFFLIINGDTEGIIIAFRWIYGIIQIISSIVLFGFLRRSSRIGAIVSSLIFLVYAPFGIMALSYNSMGIIFLSLGLVLFTCSEKSVITIIAGIFYAFSVLCCPYLAVVYVFYIVCVLLNNYIERLNIKCNNILLPKRALLFSVGVVLITLVFLIFVFWNIKITDFFAALPNILNDPEHPNIGISNKVVLYFYSIFFCNKYTPFIISSYGVVLLLGIIDQNEKRKSVYFVFYILLSLSHIISCVIFNAYINHLMLPLNFVALFCILIYKNEKALPFFYNIWIPGMIYTVCINFSSNQNIYAISSASTVALIGSILIITITIKDSYKKFGSLILKKMIIFSVSLTIIFLFCFEIYYRWNHVFWEDSIKTQKYLLMTGPEKGLLVSAEKKEKYNTILQNDLENIDESTESILFLSESTWLYLCGDWGMSSYSAWLSKVNDASILKLKSYYSLNEDKLPDVIFIEKEYEEYICFFNDNYGYSNIIYTDSGNIILQCP
ncbi:hypothetical protein JQM69_08520 [Faecalicatena contorta]|uniref:hypothetical protein n=1 Tax=Faecalicatena contorta TaxID=39482 RepID=UPI001F2D0F1F|nr:hypothetical protein [Faecalicatena contorta]MCF2680733.1 hypothetical protein [Faecalicatena contorta]